MTRRRGSFRAMRSFMAALSLNVPDEIQPVCHFQGSAAPAAFDTLRALAGAPAARTPRRMWCQRNVMCGLATTLMLLGSSTLVSARQTGPQPQPVTAAGAPTLEAAIKPPPEPDAAIKLYARVDAAVRAMDAAAIADVVERDGQLVASFVTLRLDGRVVGRGADAADDGKTLSRAVAAAVAEASGRMPRLNDATASRQRSLFAADLAISMELSGDLVPVQPETFARLDLEVGRGIEGVAARFGSRIRAVSPASMLSNQTSPGDALIAAISEASGDSTLAVRSNPQGQPPQIASAHRAVFYKFAATHLAQRTPSGPPTFLFRGGKVISDRAINTASLRQLADSMADWLVRWDGSHREPPDWPLGAYLPSRGAFESRPASLAEYALVTFAVHRLIAVKGRFQDDPADVWKWVRPGTKALAQLRFGAARLAQEPLGGEVAGPLFGCMRALVAMAPFEHQPVMPGISPPELMPYEADLASAFTAKDGWNQRIPENTRAFVAFVLARRATLVPRELDAARRREIAALAVRSLYRETKPAMLVMHMPWLGWAEQRLTEGGDILPAAAALRDMRDLVWKFQMTQADAGAEGPDLVGGIVFTSSAELLPTSQSLRPMAFLGSMLGDPRLTDASERPMQVSRMLSSLRFVRQLAIDPDATFNVVDPDAALWGIRAAVWDSRQTPEATALGLLSVCNTLESLDSMRRSTTP
jgi:hypothetical protein